jgi:hypothetical protein
MNQFIQFLKQYTPAATFTLTAASVEAMLYFFAASGHDTHPFMSQSARTISFMTSNVTFL